ncbi:ABC transporter permease [Bacteroidales bacterium OttesenSCG-928-K22]|nr:ABC transporter permease [Bacteroidales bacterium OttesenSCG-928-L14]MDL2240229.1 ABC transporter permease [Bacteroidales bacterium OttesenSCG-928-K22]
MQAFFRRITKLFTTNILNIIGLSVAFAAFIIIAIQINYDFTYDRGYKDSDRIYRLENINSNTEQYDPNICRPFGEIIAQTFPEIEAGTCIWWGGQAYFATSDNVSNAIVLHYNEASSALPNVFGLELVDGNFADFEKPGNIIIPQSVAELLFNDESAIGKQLFAGYNKSQLTIDDNRATFTVAAIYKDLPKNSSLQNTIYTNLGERYIDNRSEWSFRYYYKLNIGTDYVQLEKDAEQFLLKTYYPDEEDYDEEFIRLNPIHNLYFSKDTIHDGSEKGNLTTTISLLTIAILIVIIAIINFINFSMAAVPLNIRRINTMKVIGCTNSSLRIKQIVNVIILSIISFGIALLLVHVIAGTTFSSLISAKLDFVSNWKILVLSGVIAIITGILGGLYPAFYSTSFSPAVVLKGSFGLSVKGRKLRSSLIAVQYIISITLLIVSMFILVQNRFMKKHDVGFRTENILTVRASNTVVKQKDAFLNQLQTNPNILDITFSDGPIISSGKMGWGRHYKDNVVNFNCFPVATNFMEFFGIDVVEGRGFREGDNLKLNGTIIFNEAAKEKYDFEVDDKIEGHVEDPSDIVGIVKNFNFQPLQYKIQPIALYVFGSNPWRLQTFTFIKITGNDVKGSIDHIRKTLEEFDPDLANATINFMDKSIESMYWKEDNLAKLILIFCGLSVFISIIGILGLIFFETQFRKKEIGIRRVFGSTISEILSMLNKTYLKITFICFAISIPIAYFIIKEWLKNFAYRSPIPFWIWIVALFVIVLLTVTIISLRSLRSAKANPVESIKME